MSARVGEKFDNLVFVRPDGSEVSLHAFAGGPLVLVVLRHLG